MYMQTVHLGFSFLVIIYEYI